MITRDLLAFGNKAAVENTGKSKSVAVKNAGKKKILPVAIEMESSSPSVFVLKSPCEKMLVCKASFKPTDTTPHAGKLMIYDNVTGSPQSVGLSGTGKMPKK
jgi:hypothetical protein